MKSLEQEYHYYWPHHDELVAQYEDRYLVIQGTTVLGAYDDELEAVHETLKQGYELGLFFVQKCIREPEVCVFQSRVQVTNAF